MLRPGDTLNHGAYRIERELGAGGFGVVYLAEEVTLRRRVAIKTILPEVAAREPRIAEAFFGEARLTAGLEHPYILPIHFVGEEASSGRPLPYIVMEYVDGGDLETVLGKAPVDLHQRLRWMQQIAEGLGYAHQQGVIHRDLKPRNVFLARNRTVKIGDFGLAKALGGETQTILKGLGTPAYISPEQIQGRPADARADLYALGIMYYQMLTGLLPYDAPEVVDMTAKVMAIGYQHVHAPIPSARAVNPEVSPELDAMIQHLMAKAPEDRPASAAEVAFALDSLLGAAPRDPFLPAGQTGGAAQPRMAATQTAAVLPHPEMAATQAAVGSTQPTIGATQAAVAATQAASGFTQSVDREAGRKRVSATWLAIPAGLLVLGAAGFFLWPRHGVEVAKPPADVARPAQPAQEPSKSAEAVPVEAARQKAEEEQKRAQVEEELARKREEAARQAKIPEPQRPQPEAGKAPEAPQARHGEAADRKRREAEQARLKAEEEATRKQAEAARLAKLQEDRVRQEEARRAEEDRQTKARADLLAWTENALRKTGIKDVSVAVSPERVVTLTGTVQDQREKDEAIRLAGLGPGVKDVKSNIAVAIRQPEPAEIQRLVEQRLRENGLALTVEVNLDRSVTLGGIVDSAQKKESAKSIASGVSGVTQVKDGIFIVPPTAGPRKIR